MNKKRILIADENKIVRETISSALMDNYFVYTAQDGFVLYKKYLELKPDLIILNRDLSTFNGYEICKRIRETDKKINLLVLSDRDEKFYIERFLSTDIQGYFIIKNTNIKSVLKTAEKCLERNGKEKISVTGILSEKERDISISMEEYDLISYLLKGKISKEYKYGVEDQIKNILKKYKCKTIIEVISKMKLNRLYKM